MKNGFENGRETFPFGDIFNLNLVLNGDFSIATEFKVTPWLDFHSKFYIFLLLTTSLEKI